MDQAAIGTFIAKKRKQQNLTQEQLAERLSVSNKTVSKWETGKCMPDYSIIEPLCKELNITPTELFNGEENEKSTHTYDNELILELIQEIKSLKETKLIFTYLSIIMGAVTMGLSQMFGGSELYDFISGFFLSFGLTTMIIGFISFIRLKFFSKLRKKNKKDKGSDF